jgi:hypothetical protein
MMQAAHKRLPVSEDAQTENSSRLADSEKAVYLQLLMD